LCMALNGQEKNKAEKKAELIFHQVGSLIVTKKRFVYEIIFLNR
jgi:hypothetical protein